MPIRKVKYIPRPEIPDNILQYLVEKAENKAVAAKKLRCYTNSNYIMSSFVIASGIMIKICFIAPFKKTIGIA